jgi:acyl-CoA synthetase (AMP-forming)/AMP-acid ligase II
MQDVPLTVEMVLRRARRARTVVTATPDGPRTLRWAEVAERAARLRAALPGLSVRPGDRVATFARNTHRHVELILGIPAAGAVVHTLNIRLHRDQLEYIAGEAEDVLLFVDPDLADAAAGLTDRVVVLDDEYERLIAAAEPDLSPVDVHEDDALALCYTSGTTGDPKGVLFSHRSTVLHALGLLMVDSHAISRDDVVMPVTGLFHVLGWGLPYAVALAGGDLVLPGHSNAPPDLARLIEEFGVTKAAAVPTVWNDMAPLFAERDLSTVTELLIGGAPVPRELIRRYRRHGVAIAQGWGMTEMSPSGTMSREDGSGDGASPQGPAMPLVDLRLVGEDGAELPWDGEATGELQARGPHVAAGYYKGEPFAGGWLPTGDLARIDPDGTVRLVDRAKDLVKSGGEWISSAQLESAIAAHPAVHEAAVIAVPDERWGERPLALVAADDGTTADDLRDFLRPRVAKWWIPERFEFVDAIPRTAVGKYDKRLLRATYAG